jgi:hypothetical protein
MEYSNSDSRPSVKCVASLLFILTRTSPDGLRLFLTAIVLQIVDGCRDAGL